ncbi:MAG TPA: rRNA maturation RNase YbeY [Dehalococcoidia bacterium]|nr:rRNA maturation RNase YbeY [Dehalococcoidia bacterium]MDP7089990.1 rRNA maturation RNase YbeY [Dehalococcoidia bacterium]MDP7262165.1 rRNA maturation RNase YbeY [Dehalococcoidia bacterium]MDP7485763.1 rRNA maturation RNase YbeY [Dehalococcoidia bacterium]HJP27960.1 rRNA maturation RNase YbeY [Dehalococcoidia bacterium]
MKSPTDTDSFLSEDGRVEVVFDLDQLAYSQIALVMKAAVTGLDSEQFDGPDHITVMITGDEQIRELNRDFKGEDEITDVLSFNVDDVSDPSGNDKWPEFAESADSGEVATDRLGDIAISLPQVVRKATKNGKSADRELAMLTIHGVLHLLGYDHAELDEEKEMFGKADVVLADIFGE